MSGILEVFEEFVDKVTDELWSLLFTDTDSLTFAIASINLNMSILKEKYFRMATI